jgi:anti-sigma factor RsiW
MQGQSPIGEDDLHAYIDGRLDPDQRREVERHLEANAALRARIEQQAADAAALRRAAASRLPEPFPASLRLSEIRLRHRNRSGAARSRQFAAALAIFALGGIMGAALTRQSAPVVIARAPMADAVAAYRAFSTSVDRAVEVPAIQAAVLTSLMSRHLQHSIDIPDLSAIGLTFRGGRLLASDEGPGGMFIYAGPNGEPVAIYIKTLADGRRASLSSRKDGDLIAYFWFTGELGYAVTGPGQSPFVEQAARRLKGDA